MLFLDGGGGVQGSLDSHRHLAAEIAWASGLRTLALGYRLSGECFNTKADDDPLMSRTILLELATLYLNGSDPRSPLA